MESNTEPQEFPTCSRRAGCLSLLLELGCVYAVVGPVSVLAAGWPGVDADLASAVGLLLPRPAAHALVVLRDAIAWHWLERAPKLFVSFFLAHVLFKRVLLNLQVVWGFPANFVLLVLAYLHCGLKADDVWFLLSLIGYEFMAPECGLSRCAF